MVSPDSSIARRTAAICFRLKQLVSLMKKVQAPGGRPRCIVVSVQARSSAMK